MYSLEVRKVVLRVYAATRSMRLAGRMTGVSASSIQRWLASVTPKQRDCIARKLKPPVLEMLGALLHSHPCSTIDELRSALRKASGVEVGKEAVRLAIRKHLGWTRKRTRPWRKAVNFEKRVAEFTRSMAVVPPGAIVASIDETGFDNGLRPAMGYAPRGQRLRINSRKYGGHRQQRETVIACATNMGRLYKHHFQGHTNAITFAHALQTFPLPPGAFILLDNARFHHSKSVLERMRQRGWHPIFVPPYSPWCNPIENIFGMAKHAWRKTEVDKRNLNRAFAIVTRSTIRRSFAHAARHWVGDAGYDDSFFAL